MKFIIELEITGKFTTAQVKAEMEALFEGSDNVEVLEVHEENGE